MGLSNIHRLEKLVLLDLQSDKNKEIIVTNLSKTLQQELQFQTKQFCFSVSKTANLSIVLEKLVWLQKQDIQLNEYDDQQLYDQFLDYVIDEKRQISLKTWNENEFYELLDICNNFTYLESKLIRKIRKEGYIEVSKILQEIKTILAKREITTLITIGQNLLEMRDLYLDLEREKRKIKVKLIKASQTNLLHHLHIQLDEYRKDTILLLEGLLQTDGINYYNIKSQLDGQYIKYMEQNLCEIDKLVNMSEKKFVDKKHFEKIILGYRMMNNKLFENLNYLNTQK